MRLSWLILLLFFVTKLLGQDLTQEELSFLQTGLREHHTKGAKASFSKHIAQQVYEGNYKEAYKELTKQPNTVLTHALHAAVEMEFEHWSEARALLEKSVTLVKQDSLLLPILYSSLMNVSYRERAWTLSRNYAKKIIQNPSSTSLQLQANLYLASTFYQQGKQDSSALYWKKAKEEVKSIDKLSIALQMQAIETAIFLTQQEEAKTWLQVLKQEELSSLQQSQLRDYQIQLALTLNQDQVALELLKEGIAMLSDSSKEYLGDIQRLYQWRLQVIHLTKGEKNIVEVERALLLVKQLFYRLDIHSKAYKNIRKSSKYLLNLYIDKQYDLFHEKGDSSHLFQAFQVIEQAKQQELRILLLEGEQKSSFEGIPSAVIQEITWINHALLKVEQALFYADSTDKIFFLARKKELDKAREKWEEQMSIDYLSYSAWFLSDERVGLGNIQKQLEENQVVYSYYEVDSTLYLIQLNQQVCSFDKKILKADYFRKIRQIANFCREDEIATTSNEDHHEHSQHLPHKEPQQRELLTWSAYQETSRQLIQDYFLSFDALNDSARILFFTHGYLDYLPLEALWWKEGFVIEKWAVNYNLSAGLWLWQKQRHQSYYTEEILAWGSHYKNLADVEGMAASMQYLEEQYEGDFYIDEPDVEYYLKDYVEKYQILHFFFRNHNDVGNPQLSALVLSAESSSKSEDNILYLKEMKSLNFQNQLLFLQGYNQGIPSHLDSKNWRTWLASLSYAGVPAFVQSRWKGVERSDTVITSAFYDFIEQGDAKDIALQKAQKLYLEQEHDSLYRHPKYWANYQQIGDFSSLDVERERDKVWWFMIPILLVGAIGWWSLKALRQRRK